jgi:hypothetical protein
VIVDELYHEDIWKHWCQEESRNFGAELFIHAKHPERVQSIWVKERLIEKSFVPDWNSPEVVRAMLEVLNSAIMKQNRTMEGEFERFIFATESCIPICSLEEAGLLLFEDSKSWLQAYRTGKSRWEEGWCFESVNRRVIPREASICSFCLVYIHVILGGVEVCTWVDNAYQVTCERDCLADTKVWRMES